MENEIEELKSENEKLKKINESKSDIISVAAHQLRTSLSALKWILGIFISKEAGKLTNKQEELIQKAFNSNERMISLINDLLKFNQSEDPSVSYDFRKINIINLIEQTIFEFSEETNKKDIEIIFLKPDSGVLYVKCDENMMRVVFQNLIENAIKYNRDNGKIFISITQKEKNIQISIRDTGIGINENDKENIFKKFFRAHNALEKESIGSGIGLFTAKNIIEKHNGKIWFEKNDGEGVTFFMLLPID